MSVEGDQHRGDTQSLLARLIDIKPTLDIPKYEHSGLQRHNASSLRLTIMEDAWKDAGIDQENPGEVNQYYFEEEGLLVVDLDQDRERER